MPVEASPLTQIPGKSPFPPGITIIGYMHDDGETFDFRNYRIMRYDEKTHEPKIDWAATSLDALESFRSHPLKLERGKLEIYATCLKGNLKELSLPEVEKMAEFAYFRNNPIRNAAIRNTAQQNAEVIQKLLATAPPDWKVQFAGGLSDRRHSGQHVGSTDMTIANALSILGITAGGNPSFDDVTGPHKVPDAVRKNAMKGLHLSHKNDYGAWNFIGIARAIQLATVPGVSDRTISRMSAYFGRHVKDQKSSNFGNDASPSRGYMAWLNWGGDEGYDWANGIKAGTHRKVSKSNPITAATVAAIATGASAVIDIAKKLWPLVQSKMGISAEKWLTLPDAEKEKIVQKLSMVGGLAGYAIGRNDKVKRKVIAQFDEMATNQTARKAIKSTLAAGEDASNLVHAGISTYKQISAISKIK